MPILRTLIELTTGCAGARTDEIIALMATQGDVLSLALNDAKSFNAKARRAWFVIRNREMPD